MPPSRRRFWSCRPSLRRELGVAVLLISHNLAVSPKCATASASCTPGGWWKKAVAEVFDAPAHPYTRGLLASLPASQGPQELAPLQPIRGQPHSAARAAAGLPVRAALRVRTSGVHRRRATAPPGDRRRATSRCYFWRRSPCRRRRLAFHTRITTARAGPGRAVVVLRNGSTHVCDGRTQDLPGRWPTGGRRRRRHLAVPWARPWAWLASPGSGKSTLARVIAGLEPLDTGTLTWRGARTASRGPPTPAQCPARIADGLSGPRLHAQSAPHRADAAGALDQAAVESASRGPPVARGGAAGGCGPGAALSVRRCRPS